MAMSGARGATLAEFLAAMRLTGQPSDVEAANGKLAQLFASYAAKRLSDMSSTTRRKGPPPSSRLSSWPPPISWRSVSPDSRDWVVPEYRALLRTRYDAEIFENANPATIDAWAAERTRGQIKRVATWDEETPPDFVLINAVYFNGRWAHPFE